MTGTGRVTDAEVVEKLHRCLRRVVRFRELGAGADVIATEVELVAGAVRELVDRGALPASWPVDVRAVAAELISPSAHAESVRSREGVEGAVRAATAGRKISAALARVPIRHLHVSSGGTHAVVDGSVATLALREQVTAIVTGLGWTITNRVHVPGADSLLFETATLSLVGTADGNVELRTRTDEAVFALPAETLRAAVVEGSTLVLRGMLGELRCAGDPAELRAIATELQTRFWLDAEAEAPGPDCKDAARVRDILAKPARAAELAELSPIDASTIAALLDGARRRDVRLAIHCVAAIGRARATAAPRTSAAGLLDLIAHAESSVRAEVAKALATFGDQPRVVDAMIERLRVEPEMIVVQALVSGLGTIRGLHAARAGRALVALLSHAVYVETGDQVLPRYRAAGGQGAEPPPPDVRANQWPRARDYDPIEQAIEGVARLRPASALPWLARLCRCRALPFFTAARRAILAFDRVPELLGELRAIGDDARRDGDVATTCWAITTLGTTRASGGMQALWLASRLDDNALEVVTAAAIAIGRILERDREHVPAEVIERLHAAVATASPSTGAASALWVALARAGHAPAPPAGMVRFADAVVAAIAVPGVLASRGCAVRDDVVYAAGAATAPARSAAQVGVVIVDVGARRAALVPLPFRIPPGTDARPTELELIAMLPTGVVFVLVAAELSFVCEWRIADRAWLLWRRRGAPVPLTAELFTREHATVIGQAGLRIWVEPDGRLAIVVDGHVGHPYGDDLEWGVVPPTFLDARERAAAYARELAAAVERIDAARPGVWSLPGTRLFDPGIDATPRTAVTWRTGDVRHRVIFAESAGATTAYLVR